MALVRCPVHKIPFNDDNPRGCPACDRERGGKGRVSVMQELAKAQQAAVAPPPKPAPAPAPRRSSTKVRIADKGEPPTHPAYRRPSSASVSVPRPSVASEVPGGWFSLGALKQRFQEVAIGAIVVLTIILIFFSGPSFREGMYPMIVTGTPRPLPLHPNANVTTAFSALGTRSPKANPDSPRLARYTYGTDLMVDALNGIVYAITLRIPNRSWRGLHVGMNERTARGALALLGNPSEVESTPAPPAQEIGGYWVYPSLDERPKRTFQVGVRPPNGCYDVQVEMQPQAVGTLVDGDHRYAVVGTESAALNWVATQIRVVSRALSGPYAGSPACS